MELREIFSRFGQVQTCIVNKDKRHAFVKMYYRKDAERAKAGMEEARSQDFQLRVRPPSLTTFSQRLLTTCDADKMGRRLRPARLQ